jgi:thioredoxin 1
MKQFYIITTIAILCITGALFYSRSTQTQPTPYLETETITPTETTRATSRYTPYTNTMFANTTDARRVLFFYASWCPTCQPADASFSNGVETIPDDVMVFRVNYNDPDTDQDEKNVAKTYGITYQHTYVQIDSEGKTITKWNGGGLNELIKNIK